MKRKPHISLKWQFLITAVVTFTVAIVTALLINGIILDMRNDFSGEIKKAEEKAVMTLENVVEALNSGKPIDEIDLDYQQYIYQLDANGSVIEASSSKYETSFDIEAMRSEATIACADEMPRTYYYLQEYQDGYLLYTSIINVSDSAWILPITLVVWVFLFFVITFPQFTYIRTINRCINEVADGNLEVAIPVKGRNEITSVALQLEQMVAKLQVMRIQEEVIQKEKNQFLLNISHDLRTPLTSIIGYLNLMQQEYTSEEDKRSYLEILQDRSSRLNDLINEFFEYSTTTWGKIQLEKTPICMNEFLRHIVESFLPECTAKNLKIELSMCQEEIHLEMDTQKILRAFENILVNAIRHSQEDSVILVTLAQDNQEIRVAIANKGQPVSEETRKQMFDHFYKADVSRNSGSGGAGLGLAIAKSMVLLHDGKIWAENTDDGVVIIIAFAQKSKVTQ